MAPVKIALYVLCLLTCLGCTALLFREYLRTRASLLLWSALCFVGLLVNNALLVVDLVILPRVDLRNIRLAAALLGLCFLLYGFLSESKR